MKIKAALLAKPGTHSGWDVNEIEIDDPKEGEVRVKMHTAGLCHSDDHYDTGDCSLPDNPFVGGHEGAGVVEKIGPGVSAYEVGDHVITSWIPSCGRCHWCSIGRGNLCDRGALILSGTALDGTYRLHWNGTDVGAAALTGTFAQYIVCPEDSLIKVDRDIPLDVAALVSCGVPTGFGTAVNVAGVRPGDVCAVIGVGGIGMNAVQGARIAGARAVVAIDPVDFKREQATVFGATHTAPTIAAGFDLINGLTSGVMADRAVLAMGVVDPQLLEACVGLISKGGTLGIAGLAPDSAGDTNLNLFGFVLYEKSIKGGLYGGWDAKTAVPALLDLYRSGQLKLDELITKRYKLDEINQGYKDMREGRNIRGVIAHV